jgi:hypothetical protein
VEINAIDPVVIDRFELEASVGRALLVVAIGVLARSLLDGHDRGGFRPHVRNRR